MKDYTLSQQIALVGLDGLDTEHSSLSKTAVIRGIAVGRLLESCFLSEHGGDLDPEKLSAMQKAWKNGLKESERMGRKDARCLELEIRESLKQDGVLEEIQDILACDMNNVTAGIDIRAYRTDEDIYTGIVDRVRAEVLEEGPITLETFCLLWLIRETGCIHEIISVEEQSMLHSRMIEQASKDPLYQDIWQEEFHNNLESLAGNFLRAKKNLFKNPYLEGINLLFPFLERRQAIFIDFVVLGTDVPSRRLAIVSYLSEQGHYVQEVKYGNETLLKVDNCYYRVFPKTKSCNRIPIQGANLIPVYL